MLEGTNADDLKVYRPGIQAVKELGFSPLAEAGMTKADIRKLASEYGISVDRPASHALPPDFLWNQVVHQKTCRWQMRQKVYTRSGILQCRVRIHQDTARIEVDDKDLISFLNYRKTVILRLKN